MAIIYNPNSGKKKNIFPQIEEALKKNPEIKFEKFETERFFHTYEYANTIDLDKYSVLVAVGGDGTVHEVTNGMLHREDKKKIPMAFVPNGSGDDTCNGIGIDTVAESLKFLVKG